MANESVHAFLKDLEDKYNEKNLTAKEQLFILHVLCMFLEHVCVGRMRTHRGRVKKLIYDLNWHYAAGYFGAKLKKATE
jgi:hypothetical protein